MVLTFVFYTEEINYLVASEKHEEVNGMKRLFLVLH
jgi:hypothetical protein